MYVFIKILSYNPIQSRKMYRIIGTWDKGFIGGFLKKPQEAFLLKVRVRHSSWSDRIDPERFAPAIKTIGISTPDKKMIRIDSGPRRTGRNRELFPF